MEGGFTVKKAEKLALKLKTLFEEIEKHHIKLQESAIEIQAILKQDRTKEKKRSEIQYLYNEKHDRKIYINIINNFFTANLHE